MSETQTPPRIILPLDNMSCGDSSLGRVLVVRKETPLTQNEGGEEEAFLIENDDDSWEESCLSKFNKFMRSPIEGLEEENFDFMKKISARR